MSVENKLTQNPPSLSAVCITPQMICDTATWETIDEELRDELRVAADALEAAEKEASRLRRMVERRDDFIIANGLWAEFNKARSDEN